MEILQHYNRHFFVLSGIFYGNPHNHAADDDFFPFLNPAFLIIFRFLKTEAGTADFSAKPFLISRQRVPADIYPQNLTLHRKPFFRQKFLQLRQIICFLETVVPRNIEQIHLSLNVVLFCLSNAIHDAFVYRHVLAAQSAQRIHSARFYQAFNAPLIPFAAVHASAEICHRLERTVFLPLPHKQIHRAAPNVFNRGKPEADFSFRNRKRAKSFIYIRRQEGNSHLLTFLHIAGNLIRLIHHARHKCSHKLNGIIAFQPCRLVTHYSVADRMALIESIFCEIRHFIEYFFRFFRRNTIFHAAGNIFSITINKYLPFLRHHRGFLFAHRAAHRVTPSQAVARQIPHDLHDLFLINDTAVSIFQYRFQAFMRILYFPQSVLYGTVGRDKIHRPRAV